MPVKPSTRKPKVRSVEEKQNHLIHPDPELGIGNPNPRRDNNRALDISVNGDQFKDPIIGLGDFYKAVKYYIENKVKPSVVINNQQVSVPLEYAFPERWFAAEKQGYLRDKDGRMLLPVIAIKRGGITRNRTLGNKLDGNIVHNYQIFKTGYSNLNQYDNFSVLTNSVPRKEFRLSPVPDYVMVTYNCSVYCNYQEDLDRVIEAFTYVGESYWGRTDLFMFKATIDQYTDVIEYSQGKDRSVRSDFDITINGYILPDSVERNISTQKKFISKSQVVLRAITTSDNPDTEIRTTSGIPPTNAAVSVVDNARSGGGGGGGSLTADVVLYIDTNKSIDSISTTTNTATFNAAFLAAPAGFPATSVDDFIFFANGQYITKTAIISFIDNGLGQCILTVNTTILDYSFSSDYVVTAVGKFV